MSLVIGACGAPRAQPKQLPGFAPGRPTSGGKTATDEGFDRWDYYFNRNAIAGSVAIGDSFIGLTEAGHLLRFDRGTFALTGQLLLAHAATTLCRWRDNSLVVGSAEGMVSSLDSKTLTLTPLDTVPGRPIWVGAGPATQLAIVYTRSGALGRPGSRPSAQSYLRVFGSKRDIELPPASTFFIDSASRLWLGSDNGEWGGDIHVVDLARGDVKDVHDDGRNVYGFAEPQPGEVWAHGGLVHMGAIESYVTRLTPTPSRAPLFETREMLLIRTAKNERWLAEAHPHSPIVKIVQLEGARLLLVGYGEVFETDTKLKSFRLVAKPQLHVSPGRPDSVGSYPAVRATHVETNTVVLATAREGYVTIGNGIVTPHALPNQMGCTASSLYATGDVLIMFGMPSCIRTTDGWREVAIESWSDNGDPPPAPGSDEALVKAKVIGLRDSKLTSCTSADPELAQLLGREQLDNRVQRCARDSSGRWWLAGQGLWLVTADHRLTAVHPSLPFLTDTAVSDVVTFDNQLAIAFGDRGLAILRLEDIKPLSTTPAPTAWTERGP